MFSTEHKNTLYKKTNNLIYRYINVKSIYTDQIYLFVLSFTSGL